MMKFDRNHGHKEIGSILGKMTSPTLFVTTICLIFCSAFGFAPVLPNHAPWHPNSVEVSFRDFVLPMARKGNQQSKAKRNSRSKPFPTGKPSMAAATKKMKNLNEKDLQNMMRRIDQMGPAQEKSLKAMGMDPESMKKTIAMMKENPQMIQSAQKLMKNLTPEQLMEQSRLAQQHLSTLTPEQLAQTNRAMKDLPKEKLDQAVDMLSQRSPSESPIESTTTNVVDAPVSETGATATEDSSDDEELVVANDNSSGLSQDPAVIDAMFGVAACMSTPFSKDRVTLAGFASLPVVQLLGGDREEDLNLSELQECWEHAAASATSVDRQGFEMVWKEVQEYFEDDIVEEARREAEFYLSGKPAPMDDSTVDEPSAETMAEDEEDSPPVSSNIPSPEQMKKINEQVQDMSDDQVSKLLESMEDMLPSQEARMREMGVDPTLMKSTAKLLKDNPMMRKAAQSMLGNLNPAEILKMSQTARETISPKDTKQD